MNISGVFHREKRHPSQMYHPMHHSVASYWTEAFQKREMKHDFSDELFLNNIHLIPDPLKKNLADSLFNTETSNKPDKAHQQAQRMAQNEQEVPSEKPPKQTTTLGGIGSFFSGVMNVLTSVMFRSRATNYYDCFDVDSQGEAWQHARTDVQDKIGQAADSKSYDGAPNPHVSSEMNFDSRDAVTGCERKLNQVLNLLAPKQTSSPVWVRKRPKKVFVEPGSVGESFEDAFSPEDFCSLPNDSFIEYYSPMQYHCEELCETAAQKTMLNTAPINENTEIIKDVATSDLDDTKDDTQLEKDNVQLENDNIQSENDKTQLEKENVPHENDNTQLENDKTQLEKENIPQEKNNTESDKQKLLGKSELNVEKQQSENKTESNQTETPTIKDQVSSCEDKLSRLKALLQEKRMKCRAKQETPEPSKPPEPTRTTPPKTKETKPADKHYKNPNRRRSKRSKSKLKCRIEDDLVFASETCIGTPPSTENSPMQHSVNFGDYFDEVSGRFRTASTGSDDSFQIVFNDCVTGRLRKSSDCDSEDSFIVFEDSPDSCYVSNDVFDSESESELSDSGCGITCKLAHTLTRTVCNLADTSLYDSEDEVDFGMDTSETVVAEVNTGLLLDEKKKLLRKCQPPKTVRFSSEPPRVHVMRVWAFAARQARAGHWDRYAVDRERFKRRIADADMALSWVLKPQHRGRVMFQRFMPWWNQLKRKELAEKKEREEEEKRKAAEEKVRQEENQKELNRKEQEGCREEENQKEVNQEEQEEVNQKEVNLKEQEGSREEDNQKDQEGSREDGNRMEHEGSRQKEEKTTEDVNMNKRTERGEVNKATDVDSREKSKSNTEEKDLKTEMCDSQNQSVNEETRDFITTERDGNTKLEFNNNSIDVDNGKRGSELIIQDALARKIHGFKGIANS